MEELVRSDQTLEIFPTSVSWNTIVRQHTISPAEGGHVRHSTIPFRGHQLFPHLSVLRRGRHHTTLRSFRTDGVDDDLGMADEEMGCEVFC